MNEKILEQVLMEIDDFDAADDIPVPTELDMLVHSIICENEQCVPKKDGEKWIAQVLKACAVIMFCLSITNLVIFSPAEAVRDDFRGVLQGKTEVVIPMKFGNQSMLLKLWDAYEYPSYLPDGYKLHCIEEIRGKKGTHEENFHEKLMVFAKSGMMEEIKFHQVNVFQIDYNYDHSRFIKTKTQVNHRDAYLYKGRNENCIALLWYGERGNNWLYMNKCNDIDMLIRIAESMEYVERVKPHD